MHARDSGYQATFPYVYSVWPGNGYSSQHIVVHWQSTAAVVDTLAIEAERDINWCQSFRDGTSFNSASMTSLKVNIIMVTDKNVARSTMSQ